MMVRVWGKHENRSHFPVAKWRPINKWCMQFSVEVSHLAEQKGKSLTVHFQFKTKLSTGKDGKHSETAVEDLTPKIKWQVNVPKIALRPQASFRMIFL